MIKQENEQAISESEVKLIKQKQKYEKENAHRQVMDQAAFMRKDLKEKTRKHEKEIFQGMANSGAVKLSDDSYQLYLNGLENGSMTLDDVLNAMFNLNIPARKNFYPTNGSINNTMPLV